MLLPIRTSVTILPGLTRGTWHVDVEECYTEPVFRSGPDSVYHMRGFQLPVTYRSMRTAERAGRRLAARMGGTFRLPPEHA